MATTPDAIAALLGAVLGGGDVETALKAVDARLAAQPRAASPPTSAAAPASVAAASAAGGRPGVARPELPAPVADAASRLIKEVLNSLPTAGGGGGHTAAMNAIGLGHAQPSTALAGGAVAPTGTAAAAAATSATKVSASPIRASVAAQLATACFDAPGQGFDAMARGAATAVDGSQLLPPPTPPDAASGAQRCRALAASFEHLQGAASALLAADISTAAGVAPTGAAAPFLMVAYSVVVAAVARAALAAAVEDAACHHTVPDLVRQVRRLCDRFSTAALAACSGSDAVATTPSARPGAGHLPPLTRPAAAPLAAAGRPPSFRGGASADAFPLLAALGAAVDTADAAIVDAVRVAQVVVRRELRDGVRLPLDAEWDAVSRLGVLPVKAWAAAPVAPASSPTAAPTYAPGWVVHAAGGVAAADALHQAVATFGSRAHKPSTPAAAQDGVVPSRWHPLLADVLDGVSIALGEAVDRLARHAAPDDPAFETEAPPSDALYAAPPAALDTPTPAPRAGAGAGAGVESPSAPPGAAPASDVWVTVRRGSSRSHARLPTTTRHTPPPAVAGDVQLTSEQQPLAVLNALLYLEEAADSSVPLRLASVAPQRVVAVDDGRGEPRLAPVAADAWPQPSPTASLVTCLRGAVSVMTTQVADTFVRRFMAHTLPDVAQQRWAHFQPFLKGTRPSYGVQMWHLHLRGLVYDLQLCCGLPRHAASPPPDALLASPPSAVTVTASATFGSALATTALLWAETYMQLHPSRVRVEQYRIDVGYLVCVFCSMLPHACVGRDLSSPRLQALNAAVHGLCRVLSRTALMAGPVDNVLSFLTTAMTGRGNSNSGGGGGAVPPVATATVAGAGAGVVGGAAKAENTAGSPPHTNGTDADLSAALDVTARAQALPQLSPEVCRGCQGDTFSLTRGSSAGLRLPAVLASFVKAFGVVSTSPLAPTATLASTRFDPLQQFPVLPNVAPGRDHDSFRALDGMPWRACLLPCALEPAEAAVAISQRPELCPWEYPPLTDAELALQATPLAAFTVKE